MVTNHVDPSVGSHPPFVTMFWPQLFQPRGFPESPETILKSWRNPTSPRDLLATCQSFKVPIFPCNEGWSLWFLPRQVTIFIKPLDDILFAFNPIYLGDRFRSRGTGGWQRHLVSRRKGSLGPEKNMEDFLTNDPWVSLCVVTEKVWGVVFWFFFSNICFCFFPYKNIMLSISFGSQFSCLFIVFGKNT